MDRIHQMEVFAAINDTGSFVQASNRLRMSPPAVTRAMNALEDRLGVQLMTRSTRQLTLTDAGARFLIATRQLLAEIETAEKLAVGEEGVAQGHLTVSASLAFSRMIAAPVIRSFLASHPRISVSLIAVDRVTNIVEEGIDVAIRIGELPDSSLMAKRLGVVRRLFVASPEYLERRGTPMDPSELKLHSIIGFTGIMPSHDWHYKHGKSRGHVQLHPRFEVNDATTALTAATAGEGITMALSYMIADEIRSGHLAPVLVDYLPPAEPIHLVYPQSKIVAPKVRAFVDFATDRLTDAIRQSELVLS
ncbi:LysR family transcriptional regulator [Sulfitobacter mediterraneus]|jgi:DNA-binding transcriptional LysR family regulator|nr:LysR family transcriptional regulator [Sulfitobacter mediterraneus]KIN79158.1 Transcriptional regulator, LysR family [Sulfitobacter mediterraneus KCTC 32188]UWR12348.1 LysR family transcriptional regulator [Sulfitobacter mediterraneus]